MAPETDDTLDKYIATAAEALGIDVESTWQPAVKANLQTILRLGASVDEFELPDEAEPAPVFEA